MGAGKKNEQLQSVWVNPSIDGTADEDDEIKKKAEAIKLKLPQLMEEDKTKDHPLTN